MCGCRGRKPKSEIDDEIELKVAERQYEMMTDAENREAFRDNEVDNERNQE